MSWYPDWRLMAARKQWDSQLNWQPAYASYYPELGEVAARTNYWRREEARAAAKAREHDGLFLSALEDLFYPQAALPKCGRCDSEDLANDHANCAYWCRACSQLTTYLAAELRR
jgi:hypothetical protein